MINRPPCWTIIYLGQDTMPRWYTEESAVHAAYQVVIGKLADYALVAKVTHHVDRVLDAKVVSEYPEQDALGLVIGETAKIMDDNSGKASMADSLRNQCPK